MLKTLHSLKLLWHFSFNRCLSIWQLSFRNIRLLVINITLIILIRKGIIVKSHCTYYFYPCMAFPRIHSFLSQMHKRLDRLPVCYPRPPQALILYDPFQ